jgi:hypothetical protein
MGRKPEVAKAMPYPKYEKQQREAEKQLRGVVKDGKVELLGGSLPEGSFVKVERE